MCASPSDYAAAVAAAVPPPAPAAFAAAAAAAAAAVVANSCGGRPLAGGVHHLRGSSANWRYNREVIAQRD